MRRVLLAFAISILAFEFASIVGAAQGPDSRPQAVAGSLKRVAVPVPDGLADFVANKDAVIALGKSLFWDQQVGGDGIQACASCHFQAGADVRNTNQLNPGHNGAFESWWYGKSPAASAWFGPPALEPGRSEVRGHA